MSTLEEKIINDVEVGISAVSGVILAINPAFTLAGLGIAEIASIASAAVKGAPEVIAALSEIKAAWSGGAAPTAEQFAALKAAVDAADDQLQADVKALDQGDQ